MLYSCRGGLSQPAIYSIRETVGGHRPPLPVRVKRFVFGILCAIAVAAPALPQASNVDWSLPVHAPD